MGRKGNNIDSLRTSISKESGIAIRAQNPTGAEMVLDDHFKQVFSHREVIAVVARCLIEEIGQYSADEVAEMIKEPVVVRREVSSGMNKILSSESSVPGEATVKFDIFATLEFPNSNGKKLIRIRLDLEMQGSENPGYPLGKRSVYYCSRMISDQLEAITKETDYGHLEPVYSIWIVLTRNGKLKNSVVEYSIQRKQRAKTMESAALRKIDSSVDLINIFFIYLDKALSSIDIDNVSEDILEFLALMFQGKYDDERMARKYVDFNSDINLKKEAVGMSSYLAELEAEKREGREEGRQEGIRFLIKACCKFNASKSEIIQTLQEDYELSVEEAESAVRKYWNS